MKTHTLPKHEYSLQISNEIKNSIVDQTLFDRTNKKKSEIDTVQHKWASAKKISNDHEYIYTSSNYRKNISSIIPVSRSFFKLREIIYDFKLNVSGKNACIAEAPGGFIQSLLKFSEEHSIDLTNIFGVALVSEDTEIPYWNPGLIKHPKVVISNGSDGTGDLYKLPNILSFIKTCGKSSCQIVTADGGFDYSNDFNKQELSSYRLIYSEIYIALHIQEIKGSFILKVFDIFYHKTIQLLYLLFLSYDEIYIYKPTISRLSNSEKYIVCNGFKGFNKEIINILSKYYINTDLLHIELSDKFIKIIQEYNNIFVQNQIDYINNILEFNCKNINERIKNQIKYSKEWCEKYDININEDCIYLKY